MSRSNAELRCSILSLFLILLPRIAETQGVAGSFEELRAVVKPGDTVIITDNVGRDIQGQIAALSSSSLELLVTRIRTKFAETDVDTISRRDSRWNGTLWGLVVGATLGTLFEKGLGSEYGGYYDGSFTVLFGAVGSGVGFATDAMIRGRRLVYSNPARLTTGRAGVSVTSGKGGLSLRF